jgi:DNA modification methylase
MNNQTILGDCFEFLSTIPDNSIDAVITDPPYGIGIAKWDTVIDIPKFTSEVKRVLKKDGFYAFFGQMPTVINWINAANEEKMKYKEHIVWAKRATSAIGLNLHRTHESLFIYCLSSKKFYKNKGCYQDIKIPLLFTHCLNWETIERAAAEVRYYLKHGQKSRIKRSACNAINLKTNISETCFDAKISETNFTNLWSFLPHNLASFNKGGKEHPTQKPLELMKRLVELVTPENALILDPFAGSGTTALACLETNRDYILIEKEPDYYEVIQKRINQWHNDRLNATGTYELPNGVERIKEDKTGQLSLF